MKLKKLIPELVKGIVDNGLDENPKKLQSIGIPKIKSGADVFVIAPENSGKTTLLAISIIQQLKKAEGEVPRAVVLVQSKEDAFALEELIKKLGGTTNLRVFTVFDQGVIQYQKDMIYEGLDILIGTPKRVNELMSLTGLPITGLKLVMVDDAETFFIGRNHPIIYRIAEGAPKAQIVLLANSWTDSFAPFEEDIMKHTIHIEINEEPDH